MELYPDHVVVNCTDIINDEVFSAIKRVLDNNKKAYAEIFYADGNCMYITRNDSHFYGYKPANVISICYVEQYDDSGQCFNTEYFSDCQLESAIEALKVLYFDRSLELSGLADQLDDILEKE